MKELTTKFLKSDYSNFDEFLSEIESTSFSSDVKPETALDIEDEEEN